MACGHQSVAKCGMCFDRAQHSRRLGSKIQPSTDLSAFVGMACGRQPVAKCGMCFDGNTT